jgi:hypothetical protein
MLLHIPPEDKKRPVPMEPPKMRREEIYRQTIDPYADERWYNR